MSIATVRGGIPWTKLVTISTAGRKYDFRAPSNHLMIRTGLKQIRIYWTLEDFTNDDNYIQRNEWEGPVEANGCWLRGVAGDCDLEITVFERRA